MQMVAPAGPMYQAGTLSGNPLAMTAGIVTLRRLQQEGVWQSIADTTEKIEAAIAEAAEDAGVAVQQNRVGTMFCTYFTDRPVEDYDDVADCDLDRFASFFQAMLREGVYLPPSQFEACFVSSAHGEEEVKATYQAARRAFQSI